MPKSKFFVADTTDIPQAILGQQICLLPAITTGRFKKISDNTRLSFYAKENPLKIYSTAKKNIETTD